MTNNQTLPSILPVKRKRISLTAKNSPNLQPRRKRSLLEFRDRHSSSTTLGGPASLPTNPNLPVVPFSLPENLPMILPTPVAAAEVAELTVSLAPPIPHRRRSILTLQPKLPCTTRSNNTTFRRKRKLSDALVNVDYISDEEPIVKLFKQHETPARMFVGVPSESHRLKRNKIDDTPKCIAPTKEKNKDLEEPKKVNKIEVTLDLSQHTILPDANDVSHFPKKQQMNTSADNDVYYDALSDENDDLEEPKNEEEKDVTLHLSQHTILPSDSNVAHLQMNTSVEDDVFFDALSDENEDLEELMNKEEKETTLNMEESKKKDDEEVALNLEESKKEMGEEVVSDLSQSLSLPNAGNVAHLPHKQQINTSDEDGVIFNPLSDENKNLEESKKKKGGNVASNLVRPKEKKQKEFGLDLSQYTILPNDSYVAHLPKRSQRNTSGEDDVVFKCLLNEKKDLEKPKEQRGKEAALELSQRSFLPNTSNVTHLPRKRQINTSDEDGVLFDALSDGNKDLGGPKKKKAKETALKLEKSKKKKGKNVDLNLVRPRKKKQKKVVLDLNQFTILPNASYVAHLPMRRQMNTSGEDGVLFDTLSDGNKNPAEPKNEEGKETALELDLLNLPQTE